MQEQLTRRDAEAQARGDGEIRLADLKDQPPGRIPLGWPRSGGGAAPAERLLTDLCSSIEHSGRSSSAHTLVIEDWREIVGVDGGQVVRLLRRMAACIRIRVLDDVLARSLRRQAPIELGADTGDADWRALQGAIETVQAMQRQAQQARASRASQSRRQRVSEARHANVSLPHWVMHADGGREAAPYPTGRALRVDETLRMWNIFRWYLEGESPQTIAEVRLGQQTSFCSEMWTAPSVSRYLSLRSVISRASMAGPLGDLRQIYPALFSRKTFDLVQDLTAARSELGPAAGPNLLSGRAFCGNCAHSGQESRLHYRVVKGAGCVRCERPNCRQTIGYASVERRLLRWLSEKRDFATELVNPLAVDESALREAIGTFGWTPRPQDQDDPPSLEEHLRQSVPLAKPLLDDPQAVLQSLTQLVQSDAGRLKIRALLLRRLQRVIIHQDEPEMQEREYVAAFSTRIELSDSEKPRCRRPAVLRMEFVETDPRVGADAL